MAPLRCFLEASSRRYPQRVAVEDPTGVAISYHQLDVAADRVREELARLGVASGDRVGFCFPKSIASIVSIHGILKAEAAYVPVDPEAPASRNAYILSDCAVRVVLVGESLAPPLREELERLGSRPTILVLGETSGSPARCLKPPGDASGQASDPISGPISDPASNSDLAYILYTSGSTGRPKGVMISHANAVSFLDWCSDTFRPTAEDRFSSHAPLHFDLSVLDVHLAMKHGSTLILIEEGVGKDPARLAPYIAERAITVWYSAPSILCFLSQFGKLERYDFRRLRLVLFAGEVFPIKHLRAFQRQIPAPRYFNLYGPTETNVCTFHEIPRHIPDQRLEPYPIGKTCGDLETRVVSERGPTQRWQAVAPGEAGELCVRGQAVTRGYWNLPRETERAFLQGDSGDSSGGSWYRTGDLVREDENGDYLFLGRRDRMIKRRGYRIELDEIEYGLYQHPAIEEVGVVAFADASGEVRIRAAINHQSDKPSVLELKRFLKDHLPAYMTPDRFQFLDALPRTSTGKIDYRKLSE